MRVTALAVAATLLAAVGTSSVGNAAAIAEPEKPQVQLIYGDVPSEKPAPPAGVDIVAYTNQPKLDDAAMRVHDLVAQGATGFAKITNDPKALTMTVRWKGDPPAEVARMVGTNADGVKISVVKTRYSWADIDAAISRVIVAQTSGKLPRATSLRADESYDGILLGYTSDELRSRTPQAQEQVRSQAAAAAQMAVSFREVSPMAPTTRANDSDPWFGGGQMHPADDSGMCSTGFAVLTPPDNLGRLLSAAHCDLTGDLAWSDGAGHGLTTGNGNVRVDRAPLDTMIFDPTGGTAGKVHGGPWNATSSHSRYHLSVGSAAVTNEGDYVCTSGAQLGELCNVYVDEVNDRWWCPLSPTLTCIYDVLYEPVAQGAVTGEGNSGGPVYSNRSDGRVAARGILSGGDVDVPCPSSIAQPNQGIVCYRYALMAKIQSVLTHWQRTLETAP